MAKTLEHNKSWSVTKYKDDAGATKYLIRAKGKVCDSAAGNDVDKDSKEITVEIDWDSTLTQAALESAIDTALKAKWGF